ncbi:Uma2 family endonuclease [Streptomyces sp. MNP-20]|uniref:Uma2 family endonuclease n=1 Tax=Streptomyces sp. MNP-20 TaxID=2721165 RepID=UPI0015559AC8|nr:Uma2 family endonuclease [Streptomyces sp. MNP-20]
MTVVEDRIKMADENTRALDAMFAAFEGLPVLEGMRIEVVEGNVHMTPQRSSHWEIILAAVTQLKAAFPHRHVFSDVRIDYPGHRNGLCSDVALLAEGARADDEGRWQCEDVEFVAEVISRGTGQNDYGPKRAAYATAGVSVYLIADPYQGKVHVYTQPKNGDYSDAWPPLPFGQDVDLTTTPLGLTLTTADFPRD